MPKLSQIPDRPFAIDLRVGLTEAAQLRASAAAYSLWPEAPFGALADFGVWPGAFVPQDRANEDRIALAPDEAAYWQAFYLWDDVRDMTAHMRPLPIPTHVVSLAFDPDPTVPLTEDRPLAQLVSGGMSRETLEMDAMFMGYDMTDEFLRSVLFDGARPHFDARAVVRTPFGLVEERDAARALRRRLEQDDPAHAPLACISVWSLGERPATAPRPPPPAERRVIGPRGAEITHFNVGAFRVTCHQG